MKLADFGAYSYSRTRVLAYSYVLGMQQLEFERARARVIGRVLSNLYVRADWARPRPRPVKLLFSSCNLSISCRVLL